MDQAPERPAGAGPTTTGTSPAVSAWDEYYRQASRRRRANGGDRSIRVETRRRQIRERLGIGISAVLVSAMTLAFYLVLR
jgi:hypothetical protein